MATKDIIMKRRTETIVLHDSGMTNRDIGEQLGCHEDTIRADLKWWERQEAFKLGDWNPLAELIRQNREQYGQLHKIATEKNESNEFKQSVRIRLKAIQSKADLNEKLKVLLQETNNLYKKPDEHTLLTMDANRIHEIMEKKRKEM